MKFSAYALLTPALMFAATCSASAPVVVDAGNVVLGFYTGPNPVDNGATVVVTSRMGYIVRYDRQTGAMSSSTRDAWDESTTANLSAFYFASADCSGQPFMTAPASWTGGVVMQQVDTGARFSVAKNASPETFVNQSRRLANGTCQSGTFSGGPFLRIDANDPEVTGVSNDAAVGPLRIEVALIDSSSLDLFRDGFESTQA